MFGSEDGMGWSSFAWCFVGELEGWGRPLKGIFELHAGWLRPSKFRGRGILRRRRHTPSRVVRLPCLSVGPACEPVGRGDDGVALLACGV